MGIDCPSIAFSHRPALLHVATRVATPENFEKLRGKQRTVKHRKETYEDREKLKETLEIESRMRYQKLLM